MHTAPPHQHAMSIPLPHKLSTLTCNANDAATLHLPEVLLQPSTSCQHTMLMLHPQFCTHHPPVKTTSLVTRCNVKVNIGTATQVDCCLYFWRLIPDTTTAQPVDSFLNCFTTATAIIVIALDISIVCHCHVGRLAFASVITVVIAVIMPLPL